MRWLLQCLPDLGRSGVTRFRRGVERQNQSLVAAPAAKFFWATYPGQSRTMTRASRRRHIGCPIGTVRIDDDDLITQRTGRSQRGDVRFPRSFDDGDRHLRHDRECTSRYSLIPGWRHPAASRRLRLWSAVRDAWDGKVGKRGAGRTRGRGESEDPPCSTVFSACRWMPT